MTRSPALVAVALLVIGASACSSNGGTPRAAGNGTPPGPTAKPTHRSPKPVAHQKPVPVESNPPGDIPDNTQFVPYRSRAGGFTVRVPEGWSRRSSHRAASFTDKLNTVSVDRFSASGAPTVGSAKKSDVARLRRSEPAFRLSHVLPCSRSCTIPYSTAPIAVGLQTPAVVITYDSNSPRNSVTGRRYRLENLRFEFYRHGEEVALTLSGPVGSDNVDPWRLVSQSFTWS